MKATKLQGFFVWPTPVVYNFVENSIIDQTHCLTRFVQASRHLSLWSAAWCVNHAQMASRARMAVLFSDLEYNGVSEWSNRGISVYPAGAPLQASVVGGFDGKPLDGNIFVKVRNDWIVLSPEDSRQCLIATWVYVVNCAVGGLSGADAASLADYLRRNFGAYRWVSQERQDRQSKVWARVVADIDEGGVARTRIEASLDRVEWEQLGEDFPARADLFALTQVMKTIRLVHGRLKFEPKFASSVWVKGTAVTPRPEAFHFEPFDVDLKAWAAERDSQGQT